MCKSTVHIAPAKLDEYTISAAEQTSRHNHTHTNTHTQLF